MKIIKYKSTIVFLLLFFPIIALAQTIGQAGLDEAAQIAGFGEETDLYVIVARFTNGFLSIFMMVFTYFMVTAGFIWMTSGGNAEKVDKAKGIIKTTILGMFVASIAYILARYIIFALATSTGAI